MANYFNVNMTTYGVQVDQKWTGSGTEVDRKWIRSGPEANRKWARNEPEVNRNWTGSEPEVGQKWTGNGPEVVQNVFICLSVWMSVYKRVQKSFRVRYFKMKNRRVQVPNVWKFPRIPVYLIHIYCHKVDFQTRFKSKKDILKFVVILILPHKILITPYDKISYFGFKFDWKST